MQQRIRVAGIWLNWLLPLILVMTLLGRSQVLGAEFTTPETVVPEATTPALPPEEPQEVPAPPVETHAPRSTELSLKSFRIAGNKTVNTKDLKKQLSERLPAFWPPWGKPPTFRLQDLEYDMERLRIYYRSQGFYHTRITPEIIHGPGGQVNVTLKIDEGPWVKVIDINVEVAGVVDLSDLRQKWPLNPGDRFVEKKYDDLKNLYLNYLPNNGYPKVKVKGRVYLNEEQNTAKILLSVNPGPLCFFGGANIKDEEKLETPAAAIRGKITFKAGQIFKLDELFNTQRKLYATDLFKSVVLTPEQVPPQESTIPIVIELEEKKKRSVKFGLGYGDEDKIRVRLGLKFRNLGGGGRFLEMDARYSTLGYFYSQSFTNPVVFGTSFDFVNETGARRRYLPGFNDQAYFTQSRLERDLPRQFRVYFGHGLEFARPFNIPVETLILLQDTQPEQMYRASFVVLGIRQDTTDSHIEPRRGGTLAWANQFAPTFLGSGLQFTQSVLDLRRYQSIGDTNFVAAGRIRCGLIQPMQSTTQIPISRLFFAGGATSVRGYQLDYLGPRNASNNPIGGEAVLELSLEGRFPLPIYQKIGGVIFIDAGNVFTKIHNFDLGQLKYSPGFGFRYLSPIGAIGVDIAFPTNRINYQLDSPYQIHFTVGYGF
ncbi:MAG: BamA/TamA family outer membrane protein [Thermodesulfobacteriota bacterium]